MTKFILDLEVCENKKLNARNSLLILSHKERLPEMKPGQFAELRVDRSPSTFLRRPISINYIDKEKNEVWFLVQNAGEGTKALTLLQKGDVLNAILPLGSSFSFPASSQDEVLLVGGGVGTAPMVFLGKELKQAGYNISFLIGGRSKQDLMELEIMSSLGVVYTTTEDGSHGETGYVTNHTILNDKRFDKIYTCGPMPMMKAVAAYAAKRGIECEVSLENKMACGIGACLCCVEDTKEGHKCVCTEGPVFNIKELKW